MVGKLEEDRASFGNLHMYRYFEGLPKETILALYEFYKPDFELFGYEIPAGLI